MARDRIGFGRDDLARATANAIEASFLPQDAKDGARARHFGWIG